MRKVCELSLEKESPVIASRPPSAAPINLPQSPIKVNNSTENVRITPMRNILQNVLDNSNDFQNDSLDNEINNIYVNRNLTSEMGDNLNGSGSKVFNLF